LKTINCHGLELDLTDEMRRRVTQALAETQHALKRALRYSEEFQDKPLIHGYETHIAKLRDMLA
jgi:hypothetical protein